MINNSLTSLFVSFLVHVNLCIEIVDIFTPLHWFYTSVTDHGDDRVPVKVHRRIHSILLIIKTVSPLTQFRVETLESAVDVLITWNMFRGIRRQFLFPAPVLVGHVIIVARLIFFISRASDLIVEQLVGGGSGDFPVKPSMGHQANDVGCKQ